MHLRLAETGKARARGAQERVGYGPPAAGTRSGKRWVSSRAVVSVRRLMPCSQLAPPTRRRCLRGLAESRDRERAPPGAGRGVAAAAAAGWRRLPWPERGKAGSRASRASRAAGPCTSAGASAAGARTGRCTGGSCRGCGASGRCSRSTWRPPSWARAVRRAAGRGEAGRSRPATEIALPPPPAPAAAVRQPAARPSGPEPVPSCPAGKGSRGSDSGGPSELAVGARSPHSVVLWTLILSWRTFFPSFQGRSREEQNGNEWGSCSSRLTRRHLLPHLRQSLSSCFPLGGQGIRPLLDPEDPRFHHHHLSHALSSGCYFLTAGSF